MLIERAGGERVALDQVDTCARDERRRGRCPKFFPPREENLRATVTLAEGERVVIRLPYAAARVRADVLQRYSDDAVAGHAANAAPAGHRRQRWEFTVPAFGRTQPNRLAVYTTTRRGTVRTYAAKVTTGRQRR